MSKAPSLYPTYETGVNLPKDVTGTDIPALKKYAMDVAVQGGSVVTVPGGLKNGGRITVVTVNDSIWTAAPAVPLSNRNAIRIQNQSAVEIKLQYDPTVVGYVGVWIPPSCETYYDITDNIPIYLKCKTGFGPVDIIVEELS